jgi:hypothetical protein
METTNYFVCASLVFAILSAITMLRMRRLNLDLHKHLKELARDYQIEKHRADVYFMRLRERQNHDLNGPN